MRSRQIAPVLTLKCALVLKPSMEDSPSTMEEIPATEKVPVLSDAYFLEDATEQDVNETLKLWNDVMQSEGLDLAPVAPASAPMPCAPVVRAPIDYVVVAKRGRQADVNTKEVEERKSAHRRRMEGKKHGIASFTLKAQRDALNGID